MYRGWWKTTDGNIRFGAFNIVYKQNNGSIGTLGVSAGGDHETWQSIQDNDLILYPLLHPVHLISVSHQFLIAIKDGTPWYGLRWIAVVSLICCVFGLALSVISWVCGVLGLLGKGPPAASSHSLHSHEGTRQGC